MLYILYSSINGGTEGGVLCWKGEGLPTGQNIAYPHCHAKHDPLGWKVRGQGGLLHPLLPSGWGAGHGSFSMQAPYREVKNLQHKISFSFFLFKTTLKAGVFSCVGFWHSDCIFMPKSKLTWVMKQKYKSLVPVCWAHAKGACIWAWVDRREDEFDLLPTKYAYPLKFHMPSDNCPF